MELMIPTECPVSRAFTSYISLLINNISINNIKESTSYFPNNKYYLENINKYSDYKLKRNIHNNLTKLLE